MQKNPIKGKYDFAHLKAIHKFIFQDIYEWAGQERTVEIGKGNLFYPTVHLQTYANTIFSKYFLECYKNKDNSDDFIKVLTNNFGDLNALHPFREGNGRTQREFTRLVCLKCGYDFDLSYVSHEEMLKAGKLSFNHANNSLFIKIFNKAVVPFENKLKILSNDDSYIKIDTIDEL